MKTTRHTLDSNSRSGGVAIGHTQLRHPVQSRASDQRLRGLPFKPSRTHSLTEDHLHAKHRRLSKAPPVIARFLFPLLSPHCANPPQVLIADQALCFAVTMSPDARPLLRRDRCSCFACTYRFIAVSLVVCLIAGYLVNLFINLVEQLRQHLPVSEVVSGDDCRHYLASRFINTDVEFPPGAPLSVAVLADLPLAFTEYFHARRINYYVQRLARATAGQDNLKRLAPPAEGRVVRDGQAQVHQLHQRQEQAFSGAQPEMVDLLQSGHTKDGRVGIGVRPAAFACLLLAHPFGNHIVAEPERETSALHESVVILFPIAETIALFGFLFLHKSRLPALSSPCFMQQSHRTQ